MCLCVCVNIFLIHSFPWRTFSCFHVLVIVNNAATNVGGQISLQDPASCVLWYIQFVSRIAESHVNSFLIFWGSFILFSIAAVPFYISGYAWHVKFPPLLMFYNTFYLLSFWCSHSDRYKQIRSLWFLFAFSSWLVM